MFTTIIGLVWNRQEHRLRMLLRLLPVGYIWYALSAATRYLPLTYRYGVILGAFVVLLVGLAVLLDRRSIADYGFTPSRWSLPDLGFGVLLGSLLVGLVFLLFQAFGWLEITGGPYTYFRNGSVTQSLLIMCGVFIVVAITEEVVFRGVLIKNFAEGLSHWLPHTHRSIVALVLSALLFGYVHFDNPSATLLSNLNLVLFGLVMALPYMLTGSLLVTLGFHLSWNFTLLLFGLPVSGFVPFVALFEVQVSGPAWLTGGSFGPEGGVIGTVSALLQAGAYLFWIRMTRGELVLWRRLGHYRPLRIFAMTPGEIRAERHRLLQDEEPE